MSSITNNKGTYEPVTRNSVTANKIAPYVQGGRLKAPNLTCLGSKLETFVYDLSGFAFLVLSLKMEKLELCA
jgi:hypothetical protein